MIDKAKTTYFTVAIIHHPLVRPANLKQDIKNAFKNYDFVKKVAVIKVKTTQSKDDQS